MTCEKTPVGRERLAGIALMLAGAVLILSGVYDYLRAAR
jgi:hypothetical protein